MKTHKTKHKQKIQLISAIIQITPNVSNLSYMNTKALQHNVSYLLHSLRQNDTNEYYEKKREEKKILNKNMTKLCFKTPYFLRCRFSFHFSHMQHNNCDTYISNI